MRRGFTLLELLIALAIRRSSRRRCFSRGGDTVRQLYGMEQRTLARWVAENEVAEMRLERWRDGKKKRDAVHAAISAPRTSGESTGAGNAVDKPKQLSLGSRRHNVKLGERSWQVRARRASRAASRHAPRRGEGVSGERGRPSGPVDTLTAFVGRY